MSNPIKVCKWCGHEYLQPCDGDPKCGNYPLAEAKRKAKENDDKKN